MIINSRKRISVPVLFENDHLMIINKPAGMIANRAETTKEHYTLQDWLNDYLGKSVLPWSLRHGLVHRLDKETSGLMVVAKSASEYQHLLDQFKSRKVDKSYLALAHGKLEPVKGSINLPIKRDPKNRKKFMVRYGGRMAHTLYELKTRYLSPKEKNKSKKYFSLVKLQLLTGRTHQIKVHLSHLHYPVVADTIYAGKKTSRQDRLWCPRLFLQSVFLSFTDHNSNKQIWELALDSQLKEAVLSHLVEDE